MTITRICRYLALIFFAALSAQGFWAGYQQLAESQTTGQWIQTASQWVWGTLGTIITVQLVRRRTLQPALEWLWGGALTLSGAIAAVVWGGSSILIGTLSGSGTAAIA